MSKPWRMVVLHAGAWAAFATAQPAVLDWTCAVIVVGCIQTIAVRLRRILTALHATADNGLRTLS